MAMEAMHTGKSGPKGHSKVLLGGGEGFRKGRGKKKDCPAWPEVVDCILKLEACMNITFRRWPPNNNCCKCNDCTSCKCCRQVWTMFAYLSIAGN